MMALRLRCCGVTSSDVVMDYFLADGLEFFDDDCLQSGVKTVPDGVGRDGHKISYCSASVTNSVILSNVSLLPSAR